MFDEESLLSEAEERLRKNFVKKKADRRVLPSNAAPVGGSARVDQLVLPDTMRAKMPLTMDKYLVKEDMALVEWEREVRKFLRRLSPDHGHRVSAIMLFEWCTGLLVSELVEDERRNGRASTGRRGTWRADLRRINKVLTYYFGKHYMTYIAGRKVPKAYRVPPGYYIRTHRPMTLVLFSEYLEGTLYP